MLVSAGGVTGSGVMIGSVGGVLEPVRSGGVVEPVSPMIGSGLGAGGGIDPPPELLPLVTCTTDAVCAVPAS